MPGHFMAIKEEEGEVPWNYLAGFGIFNPNLMIGLVKVEKLYLKYQKRRKIRHPLTGKSIIVGPKKTVQFKCFKSLYQEINYFEFDMDEFNEENKSILQQLYDLIENSGDYEEEEGEGEEEDLF